MKRALFFSLKFSSFVPFVLFSFFFFSFALISLTFHFIELKQKRKEKEMKRMKEGSEWNEACLFHFCSLLFVLFLHGFVFVLLLISRFILSSFHWKWAKRTKQINRVNENSHLCSLVFFLSFYIWFLCNEMKRNKKPNNKKKKRKQNKDIDVIYNVMVSEENDE